MAVPERHAARRGRVAVRVDVLDRRGDPCSEEDRTAEAQPVWRVCAVWRVRYGGPPRRSRPGSSSNVGRGRSADAGRGSCSPVNLLIDDAVRVGSIGGVNLCHPGEWQQRVTVQQAVDLQQSRSCRDNRMALLVASTGERRQAESNTTERRIDTVKVLPGADHAGRRAPRGHDQPDVPDGPPRSRRGRPAAPFDGNRTPSWLPRVPARQGARSCPNRLAAGESVPMVPCWCAARLWPSVPHARSAWRR